MGRYVMLLLLLLVSTVGAAAQEGGNLTTYIVRQGNTLDQVAEFFNVSAECIAERSGIANGADITPGQILTISDACPPYVPVNGQGGGTTTTITTTNPPADEPGQGGGMVAADGLYTVRRGDKLALIARDNGVSLTCLVIANRIFNPNLIYVGQQIFIPNDCTPFDQGGGEVPGQPITPGTQVILQTQVGAKIYTLQPDGSYIVRSGDILDFIALAFNVDTACLAASNQLVDPARLQPGQILLITPGCPGWSGPPGPSRRVLEAVG